MKIRNTFQLLLLSAIIPISLSAFNPSTIGKGGKPIIEKLGTLDCDMVETTPIVFKDQVYRFEYVRTNYWDNNSGDSYFRFVDHKTGKRTTPFAKGFHFGSASVLDGIVYVTAVNKGDGERITIFKSTDLEHWESWLALELPGWGMFNTSMIKAKDKYVLMFEVGKPEIEAGERFTAHFATSTDLKHWTVLSREHNYAMDRYTAPHCLRYLDGYYYDFYLEAFKGYEARVVRSKDLINWEASPYNPVLKASPEDKLIINKTLPDSLLHKIKIAENWNNSDIDFCEYRGKLIINYSWGNQLGKEFLGEAVYRGTQAQFLKGWFPAK
ncbi:MAG: hypothetical protein NTV75_10910 [Bacteroidia bacterium]|nr:hypothetical protein [Bacteroidia bacterium]